jgi:hypothetical protein
MVDYFLAPIKPENRKVLPRITAFICLLFLLLFRRAPVVPTAMFKDIVVVREKNCFPQMNSKSPQSLPYFSFDPL